MRLHRLDLDGHRSVECLAFDAGPFTVLFGKNNAGKTNVLETLYGILAPQDNRVIRRTHADRGSNPVGAIHVELEPGLPFDDKVLAAVRSDLTGANSSWVAFTRSELVAGRLEDYFYTDPELADPDHVGAHSDHPGLHALFLNWRFVDLHEQVEATIAKLARTERQRTRGDWPWLETVRTTEERHAYRVPPATEARVDQLAALATDLLPDFVDGSINAHVTAPALWGTMPKVLLEYGQRGLTQCADSVDVAGEGAARWIAAAVQIALHLMEEYPGIATMRDLGARAFSGHVLLIDEPEAHLHPAAVASMVRWCHRMVHHGFTVIVASHHEEFLRSAGEDVTLVHITRNPDLVHTSARALPTTATLRLQDLATDIGMHPASILSLHRAVLFVEGPLDEAVLSEYAGLELDAIGVKVIPIHGTKNLEGLIDAEIVSELGIEMGILTDATDPSTMADRSRKKRSSEEKKVLRVIQMAEAKGLPAVKPFGVPESDLLFALPVEAIRNYLKGPFPEWENLVAECRAAEDKSPSDSVNWKAFAEEHYGLPLTTPSGVRDVVRKIDLAGVALPSIRKVVDEIVEWAR